MILRKIYTQALGIGHKALGVILPVLVLAIAQGCASDKDKNKTAMDTDSGSSILDDVPAERAPPVENETDKVIAQLDRDYVIGPTAAGVLNYRVDWQFKSPANTNLKAMALRGESVYLLDDRNYLTRINIVDGKRMWREQIADPVNDILSINVVDDRVYLTTGSEMLVRDAGNGTQVGKWPFTKIAGTQPVEFANFLIFGARSGELVWIARQIGHMWRAYRIDQAIRVPPVIRGNVLAAVGSAGMVMVLDASTATKFWGKRLLEPVVRKPVIGEDALYVAGQDQYIWCYELRSGRTLWHVMTEAPLTSSPAVFGDRLYQQIPGYGLSCFEAMPIDTPGGKFVWKNEAVTGNVIQQRRGDVWAWDHQSKVLTTIEATRGLTKRDLHLAQADYLMLGGAKGEEIFAANNDGRLVRLVPRN